MAVSYYQFEAIHPFTDGNGRTGRVLNFFMLVEQSLLDLPVLYLSRCVIRNKSAYYAALLAVTARGAWQEWILYMLHATEDTAKWTFAKIEALRKLIEQTAEFARNAAPKQSSLESIGVLEQKQFGLNKLFLNSRFLKLLTQESNDLWRSDAGSPNDC